MPLIYPQTVREVLEPNRRYRPAALRALRRFARSHPWRGTLDERKQKFRRLNRDLARAYGIRRPALHFILIGACVPSNGFYRRRENIIGLIGKLSVVTYLHEFGHARGFDEFGACRFSINLFARIFPRAFARCDHDRHMLIRTRSAGRRPASPDRTPSPRRRPQT